LFAHAESVNLDPSPSLRKLWGELWEDWDNPEAHERFRQSAIAEGDLAQAGRLYQLRLARVPGDVQAELGRSEVLRLVSTVASLVRTPVRDTRRVRQLAWGTLIVLVATLSILMVRFLLNH
jgi:hypothetical protein